MLKSDYETPIRTLGQPLEFGVKNKYGDLRNQEVYIEQITTEELFPHRQIIRFNSIYMELIDSWERVRGHSTALALPVILMSFAFIVLLQWLGYIIFLDSLFQYIPAYLFIFLMFSWLIYVNYKMCRYDLFGLTHYPVRFNRKTKKVYAFSPARQKIIEMNWDEIRFTTLENDFDIELRASIVDKNNLVIEEIIMPYRAPVLEKELLYQNMAFLKLYMEGDDLKRVDESIHEFFDIYSRKESAKETCRRLYMLYNYKEGSSSGRENEKDLSTLALAMILVIPTFFLRRLGLLCSKLPVWPDRIEQECQIEKNDPYDSTGKTRYLPPIKFTVVEYIVLALGFLIVSSIFVVFFAGVIYFGLNVME